MATMSLRTFAKYLDHLGEKFEKDVNREVRNVVNDAHYTFAEGVPVDTGEARSNTRGTSAKRVPTNVIPAYAPGSKLGRKETSNLNAANAQCKRASRVWRASTGKPFTIFNNWPLIDKLNDGTISKQGSRFAERAERVAERKLGKVRWFR